MKRSFHFIHIDVVFKNMYYITILKYQNIPSRILYLKIHSC